MFNLVSIYKYWIPLRCIILIVTKAFLGLGAMAGLMVYVTLPLFLEYFLYFGIMLWMTVSITKGIDDFNQLKVLEKINKGEFNGFG